jgi:hypothetical protein
VTTYFDHNGRTKTAPVLDTVDWQPTPVPSDEAIAVKEATTLFDRARFRIDWLAANRGEAPTW